MLPASDLAEGLFNNVDRPPVCDARGPGRPLHGVRYGQARGANRTGAIGVVVVFTQRLGYTLYFLLFQRTVPSFRLSARHASIATLRRMASFGMHSFLINLSSVFLNQSPPILIGHFLPTAYLAYFQYPMKLIQYTGDAVARIGIITNAHAAELHARGDSRALSELAIYANRYSLPIFMPVAIALWVFGDRLFRLWVPSIAPYSAPLLPIFLTGYMAAVVPQFSSGMLLQGLGRHQRFARGLLAEAVAVVFLLAKGSALDIPIH
jgi:O-antigen/teichoic acid export membrane protein